MDVPPTFELEAAARTEDDAYSGNGSTPERGLEEDLEETEEFDEGEDPSAAPPDDSDLTTKVNVFA